MRRSVRRGALHGGASRTDIVSLANPGSIDLSLQMDWRVVLYAFLLSLGTGILCGVGPAIVGSRPVLQNSLKGEAR